MTKYDNAAEEAYALLLDMQGPLLQLQKLAGESPASEVCLLREAYNAAVLYVDVQRTAHRRQAELCAFINGRP